MPLEDYLARVGFDGEPRPDFDTLRRLHRGHLASIPYENLGVLLGETLDFDIARIFDKLVHQRRGGWCYEMNGLFAWALETIGFRVTRLAGAVIRDRMGDDYTGNHLVLCVDLDQPYLADVGFGDGLVEPIPLTEHTIEQDRFVSKLARVEGGWWRFHNHQHCGAPSFDFRNEPAATEQLAGMCTFLQSSDKSPFTQNVVLQRRLNDRVEIIRNAFRMTAHPDRLERRVMQSADEMLHEMRVVFGIDVPAARTLWPLAQARGQIMQSEHPL
jgi:N-hydroxyarylamine O-acetyltransferase